MPRLYASLLCLALVPALGHAAIDPTLLSLVMPDAKFLAGAQVEQVKASPFGRYVLAHMQFDDPGFQKFLSATGFDPARDIGEVLVAANTSDSGAPRFLVLAKGNFDVQRIQGAAQANGGKIARRNGATIITGKDQDTMIAFLDSSTAAIGHQELIDAAVDHRRGSPSGSLIAKAQQMSGGSPFWYTSSMPVALFAGAMPDSNLASAMKGSLLQSIQQASGSIKFGSNVDMLLEAVAKTPADATALMDVIKFLAGLIQTNRQNDKTAARVSTLVDNLHVSTQGNVMTMTLTIPETTLEQMMESMRQPRGGRPAPQP